MLLISLTFLSPFESICCPLQREGVFNNSRIIWWIVFQEDLGLFWEIWASNFVCTSNSGIFHLHTSAIIRYLNVRNVEISAWLSLKVSSLLTSWFTVMFPLTWSYLGKERWQSFWYLGQSFTNLHMSSSVTKYLRSQLFALKKQKFLLSLHCCHALKTWVFL